MPTLEFLEQLQKEHDDRKKIFAGFKEPEFHTTFDLALKEALELDPIVISPYVYTFPETIEAMSKIGYPVARIPCPEETSYYDALVACYKTGKTVIVIEHDMLPRPDSVQELLDCKHDWCGFLYRHRYGKIKACLGLTKLNLYEKFPNIFDKVSSDWRYMDGVLEGQLFTKNMKIHEHLPIIEHSNPLIEVPGAKATSDIEGDMMLTSLFLSRNAAEIRKLTDKKIIQNV